MQTKKIMMRNPAVLHALLEHLTEALIVYVIHQIDSGAQVCNALSSPLHMATTEVAAFLFTVGNAR
jgi:uroporphyrinogen-III decarboxylase